MDGLRLGVLVKRGECWSDIRTMLNINMGLLEESGRSSLDNEEQNGPDEKPGSQKPPCQVVVGFG